MLKYVWQSVHSAVDAVPDASQSPAISSSSLACRHVLTDPGNSVFALCALPTAFIADFTEGRVWVLTVAALWWSLCVLFQGLSHNFTEILLARIGMGIGQAPVEALSVSLISDMV